MTRREETILTCSRIAERYENFTMEIGNGSHVAVDIRVEEGD